MRKEPYTVGSYVHVIKRGSRGLPIVKDENDRRRFLLMLRHFNDEFYPDNWFKDLLDAKLTHSFERPTVWPSQKRIVEIICYCLVENHFHFLLREIVEGGIARFMKRLGVGMAKYFNEKYKEKGSLFQGAYRSKTISDDTYFHYVSAYIQVKNCLELHPSGYHLACRNFENSFLWAEKYPYSSLGEFTGVETKNIITRGLLSETFTPTEYKEFCRDFISSRLDMSDIRNEAGFLNLEAVK